MVKLQYQEIRAVQGAGASPFTNTLRFSGCATHRGRRW